MNKRFSGRIGEDYDLFKSICPYYEDLQNIIEQKLFEYSIENNGIIEVLEIGCGTGHTTGRILRASQKISVTAVDNEKIMIEQARISLGLFNFESPRVKFVLNNAIKYLKSVEDETFDAFASAFTLHNFERNYREEVLREIYRCLKNRGFFINSDKYYFGNEKKDKIHSDWQLKQFDKFEEIGRPDLKKEWVNHYLEDEKPYRRMTEPEQKKLMQEIGFKKIKRIFRKHLEAIITAQK